MKLPRGLRNNNPLNIIHGERWKGLAGQQTDPKFCQFQSIEYGYRAAFIILHKYINIHKANTIEKIVDRWAPDGEPYQSNYKKSVERLTGIHMKKEINFSERETMVDIVQAMAKVENGQHVDREPIYRGYEMV